MVRQIAVIVTKPIVSSCSAPASVLEEIAETKMPDLNANDIDAAMKLYISAMHCRRRTAIDRRDVQSYIWLTFLYSTSNYGEVGGGRQGHGKLGVYC